MRSNRFFTNPNQQPPYYPYQAPFQSNGFPPQPNMHHQSYPSPYQQMPFHQGKWQPPHQSMGAGQQKSLTKGIMGYFQNDEGQLDFDKVLNTAGQVGNTYQQVSPLVKGIGSFFKGN